MPISISIGTVGGIESFAGQATVRLRRMYPELAEPVYFRGGAELFEALSTGTVEAIIGAESSIAGRFAEFDQLLAKPGSALCVVAEAQLPFKCQLIGAPGSALSQLRTVYGGPVSIEQAAGFLKANLATVAIATYTDAMATAQAVADSDGTIAILGTEQLAARFGLSILAQDVDGLVNGNWWALSSKPHFAAQPGRLVVVARFPGDGSLGRLLERLHEVGFSAATIAIRATHAVLHEADYIIRLIGNGELAAILKSLEKEPRARLAGALRSIA